MATRKKNSAEGGGGEELSFEAAMEEVEGIVEALESDDVPLEKLLEKYERGTALIQVCQARISAAEERVEVIARRASGERGAEAFDPESKGGGGGDAGDSEIKLL